MNSLLMLFLLTVLQLVAGSGLLALLKIRMKLFSHISLSVILGIAIFSLLPFLLQLSYVPLTKQNILYAIIASCIVLNVKWKYNYETFAKISKGYLFKTSFYEIPFIIFITFLLFLSCWRSFYLPPTPRDLTSGPEVLAEYAVKEKTLVNSVFTVNLETTNNQYKPAYIASLQIIYKYCGFPFGDIWQGLLTVCFIIFLYNCLRLKLHRIICYFLICAFLAIPEMYGYTFMVLFDYSNAVFLFLCFYFLFVYFQERAWNYLLFASLLLGVATYIRSETLLFGFFMLPILLAWNIRSKASFPVIAKSVFYFLIPAAILYFISVPFYIHQYLPVKYEINNQINDHLTEIAPLVTRFFEMNRQLIFGSNSAVLYGTFIYLFIILFVLELAFAKKLSGETVNWLTAICIIYLGLPLIGFLLPLFDLGNTTKRGLFKIFPLMLLYMSTNQVLLNLSKKIEKLESR